MKKAYTKPELFCEEYELSVSIAGNCGAEFSAFNVLPTGAEANGCGYNMRGKIIFIEANNTCQIKTINGSEFGLCYQVPTATTLAFSS